MKKGTADRITESLNRRQQHKEIDKKSCSSPPHSLDRIENVWFQALEDINEVYLTDLTETLTDYVTVQGINGDRLLWNHFGTNGLCTNNSSKRWHGKLKLMVQHAHLNIYTVIKIF